MFLSICSLLLFCSVTMSSLVDYTFTDIVNVAPFNGSSLTNTSSGCSPVSFSVLSCGPNSKLNDNVTEPAGPLFDNLGTFFAFDGQSNIQIGLSASTTGTSHVVIYFVNFPSIFIGLPSFTLSTTNNVPVPFIFADNSDLTQSDSTVKNITLIATSNIGNLVKISMNFTNSNIDWFLVSEIKIYDGFSPPTLDLISFQDGSSALISLGPDNLVSSLSVTCTVAISGSFEWVWQYEGNPISSSDDRFQISTFDATRTSVLAITGLRFSDRGSYFCIASHMTDSTMYSNRTNEVELNGVLQAQNSNVSATVGQTASLQCQLYGYISVIDIKWKKDGQELQGSGKYSFVSGGTGERTAITADGIVRDGVISTLMVTNVAADDDATYSCFTDSAMAAVDIYLNIIEVDVSSFTASTSSSTHQSSSQQQFSSGSSPPTLPPQSPTSISNKASSVISSTSVSVTRSSSSSSVSASNIGSPTALPRTSSNSMTIIIVVVVVILIVILLVAVAIISLVLVMSRIRKLNKNTGGNRNSVLKPTPPPVGGEPFYSEINAEKPNKYTIIAPYSETEFLSDSSNGSMTKVVSTSQDPMYQEIPEVPEIPTRNPPTSPPKAIINPKLLKENPMYTSADDLDAQFIDSDFNIYAQPNMPPPIPDYNGTPDASIYNESIYSVDLNPSHFKSHESLAKTEHSESVSPYLMPYSSIYSNPEPIVKSDIMEVNETHISEIKELGIGQFGRVLLAHTIGLSLKDLKLSNSDSNVSILVAVKRLSEDADQRERQAFEKEIKFMARLKHENVVSLLGVCLSKNAFIMMEYMENGDLNQFLQKFDLSPQSATTVPAGFLSPSVLIYMCLQISSGMRYLASLNFVHRDLAARNCLVGQKYVIKIADFGMSRKLYDRNYYRIQGKAVLPIRWMSSECFYGRFSEMTDVWAFGVTMWEIFNFCRVQPYENFSDQDVIDNAIKGQDTVLLEQPHGCPDDMYGVLVKCWHHDPMKRVRFVDIHGHLSQIHAYSDMG